MAIVLDGTSGITTPNVASDTSTLGPLTQALNLGSTGQIVFPATQNASANANTLDDYEEGTWTPGIGLFSGSPSYPSRRYGYYIKIGRVVQIWVDVVFTASSGVTMSDLTGLPFVVDSTAVFPTIAVGNSYFINLGSGGTVLGMYPFPGASYLRFHSYGNNTDQLSPSTTNQTMNIRFEGVYLATA